MDCNKTDCIHYKVCEEWKSHGNDNYINESNGNCDCYSVPYNPSGDLISRKQVVEELMAHQYSQDFCKEHGIEYSIHSGMVRIIVNSVPTVEAYTSEDIVKYVSATEDLVREKLERPQGAWVDSPDGLPKCCCSLCGAKNVTIWHSFCPNCGAKMSIEAEDAAMRSKIDYLMQTMNVSATRAVEIIHIITGEMHI